MKKYLPVLLAGDGFGFSCSVCVFVVLFGLLK